MVFKTRGCLVYTYIMKFYKIVPLSLSLFARHLDQGSLRIYNRSSRRPRTFKLSVGVKSRIFFVSAERPQQMIYHIRPSIITDSSGHYWISLFLTLDSTHIHWKCNFPMTRSVDRFVGSDKNWANSILKSRNKSESSA